MKIETYDFFVIGGGASGFFAAINAAQLNPSYKIGIIEKNREVLQKVKVSGGGRCNVTHACFEASELIENYPRGRDFLLDAFKTFGPSQTMAWFERVGVKLKIEPDGRVFPLSNSSQTIVDCFLKCCKDLNISIFKSERVEDFQKKDNIWQIETDKNGIFKTKKLMIATGSDQRIWKTLFNLGLPIKEPVPSLFTFNIKEDSLKALQGLSFEKVAISIDKKTFRNQGPFLITHWGVSGPAVLKLSAWAARDLFTCNYAFDVLINWLPDYSQEVVSQALKLNITEISKKNVMAHPPLGLSQRFWRYICEKSNIQEFQKWAETGKKHIAVLKENLLNARYSVDGKSTFKEEFVTAGGIELDAIDLQTFSLKTDGSIFFAGEVLNIDAITGGFNFQAAWTGGFLVANAV
jgi:predicted Rossmann fold flavoprotein